MIIVDNSPDSKTTQLPPPATAPGEQSKQAPPPPAYGATDFAYTYPDDVPMRGRERFPRGENARRRFAKAFVTAFGVWILLCILAESLLDVTIGLHAELKEVPFSMNELTERITSSSCVSGDDGLAQTSTSSTRTRSLSQFFVTNGETVSESPFHIKFGFSLPASSDLLYFFNNGSQPFGSITIDAGPAPGENITVDIVVSYYTKRALHRSRVCLFEDGGERGVGVVTPDVAGHPSRADRLRYDIHVALPASSASPLNISRLHTNFTHFAHSVGELDGVVNFGELYLRAKNVPLVVQSVSAEHARLQTMNAPITGNYSTSASLELETANAPIKVDVRMYNDPEGLTTKLVMRTVNSPLEAHLHMSSSSSQSHSSSVGSNGNFSVHASTSNSPLSLSFLSQPPSSRLSLAAKTTKSPARVALASAYEGIFRVASTGVVGWSSVQVDEKVEDPTGAGRVRVVDITRVGIGEVHGSVWWQDEQGSRLKEGGRVLLETSLLRAVLKL